MTCQNIKKLITTFLSHSSCTIYQLLYYVKKIQQHISSTSIIIFTIPEVSLQTTFVKKYNAHHLNYNNQIKFCLC